MRCSNTEILLIFPLKLPQQNFLIQNIFRAENFDKKEERLGTEVLYFYFFIFLIFIFQFKDGSRRKGNLFFLVLYMNEKNIIIFIKGVYFVFVEEIG